MKTNDRVRMVQTTSTGTIAGEPETSPLDGGERLPVRWDGSGDTTRWHPGFLRPADSDPAADPDEVQIGSILRRRACVRFDEHGTLLIIPEGFARAKP